MNTNPDRESVFLKMMREIVFDRRLPMTVSELARKSRIDRSYLYHTLAGRKPLSVEQLYRICDTLRLSEPLRRQLMFLCLSEGSDHPGLKSLFLKEAGFSEETRAQTDQFLK